MSQEIEKFKNLTILCKNFSILYTKAFYTISRIDMISKNNKINMLKNRLSEMMLEFINSSDNVLNYQYDYLLDGGNHVIYNIPSAAIVIIHNNSTLIYDIFADIFYYIINKQLYINNVLYVAKNDIKFEGNLQCDALLLVYHYMGLINSVSITNAKLRQYIL